MFARSYNYALEVSIGAVLILFHPFSYNGVYFDNNIRSTHLTPMNTASSYSFIQIQETSLDFEYFYVFGPDFGQCLQIWTTVSIIQMRKWLLSCSLLSCDYLNFG